MFFAPHERGDEVDSLGGAAREDDFVFGRRIDEFRGAGAAGLKGVGGAIAQFVNAAMDVGVVVLVVAAEGIDDGAGFLTAGGVVKIDQGMPVDLLVEDGEIGAERLAQSGAGLGAAAVLGSAIIGRRIYIKPSCSLAASVSMPWFHWGSQTSSTLTSLTPSTERTCFARPAGGPGPMPQPRAR